MGFPRLRDFLGKVSIHDMGGASARVNRPPLLLGFGKLGVLHVRRASYHLGIHIWAPLFLRKPPHIGVWESCSSELGTSRPTRNRVWGLGFRV